MEPHRELFNRYERGELDESSVTELHRLLAEKYFNSPADLGPEEMAYTEDFILEAFANGSLDEKYQPLFEEMLRNQSSLYRKYSLFTGLGMAAGNKQSEHLLHLAGSKSPETEEQEEEQLTSILQEVIEKVHSGNEESSTVRMKQWISRIASRISNLLPPQPEGQPLLRPALLIAAVAIVAFAVWIAVKPGPQQQLSWTNPSDTASNKEQLPRDSARHAPVPVQRLVPPDIRHPNLAHSDSILKKEEIPEKQYAHRVTKADTIERELKALDRELLACADDIPSTMEYMELRSVSSEANGLFIEAARKYNARDLDGCILILNQLIRDQAFKDQDTLDKIRYYLGNSYLSKGFQPGGHKWLNAAVSAFQKVSKQSPHYNDSRWYEALALIKAGKTAEGKRILTDLLKAGYYRSGEVKSLNDRTSRLLH